MSDSRISGLHKLTIAARIEELGRRGILSSGEVAALKNGAQVLLPASADRMIENVLGTFGLPFAIAANFVVNGRACIVPMVVEEPSVVAGCSAAAKLALPDGFSVSGDEALLAGQIHITGVSDPDFAVAELLRCKTEIIAAANAVHPGMAAYGGGARDLEVRILDLKDGTAALAVHILVATGNAMGANVVNTICESLAPKIGELCGGDAALKILSNLVDRSLLTAKVRYPLDSLASADFAADLVRDRIVMASKIAVADPYRAATHNKGIMNGIDALAIATGNDWRAIEAAAHAYASLSGQYQPLAVWSVATDGDLLGTLTMPLRAATVGGTALANPAVALGLRMTGVASARELGELMAAVGLAQNFAAIRALATRGIQAAHMPLHARHKAAGSPSTLPLADAQASAAGKVILLGEHAVVYGKHALAIPIENAVTARITRSALETDPFCRQVLQLVCEQLELDAAALGAEVHCRLPVGMGLGSSAAIAVAIARAVSVSHDLDLNDEQINSLAFDCEKLAHGNPSGIDNSIATYSQAMLFSNAKGLDIEIIQPPEPPPMVIALSSQQGLTHEQVAGVAERYGRNKAQYAAVFEQIDALSIAAAAALKSASYAELGELMNICHGLLNALQVSTPQIENIVSLARSAGAAGAKLTGAGGGGAVAILCPGAVDAVLSALTAAGIESLPLAGNRDV